MIAFNQVSKTFKRQCVLNNVTLTIQPGQHVALIGSNGAGKTTLMRCLLGEYCYEGTVRVDGLCPRTHRQAVLNRIGFVPQLPPPLKMPVKQLIHFAANVCGSQPQRMIEITQRLGLELSPILTKPFIKLSGGQKQKLLISIALGRDTDILIMDEPAANLDPEARRSFFELLAERQEHAITLISSHRIDELATLVNRVLELDLGKVVLDDLIEDRLRAKNNWLCRLTLSHSETVLVKTLQTWQFSPQADNLVWNGQISGAERLRFLGMLSRYSGLLTDMTLQENN